MLQRLICESLSSLGHGSVCGFEKRYFQKRAFQGTAHSQLLGPHPSPFIVEVTHSRLPVVRLSILLRWWGSQRWHVSVVVWANFRRSLPPTPPLMIEDHECSSLTRAFVSSLLKELKMVPFVQAELLGNQGELDSFPRPLAPVSSSHFYGMLSKEPKEALRDAPNVPKSTKLSNQLLHLLHS